MTLLLCHRLVKPEDISVTPSSPPQGSVSTLSVQRVGGSPGQCMIFFSFIELALSKSYLNCIFQTSFLGSQEKMCVNPRHLAWASLPQGSLKGRELEEHWEGLAGLSWESETSISEAGPDS